VQQYPDDVPITDIEEVRRDNGNDRVPPHSIELEQQVLGAMLLSRQAVSKAAVLVDDQAFYRGRHREIFKVVVQLYESGSAVDLPLIAEALDRLGVLEECGGTAYLADVAAAVGTSVNVEHHAKLLLEKAVRRKTISLASQLVTESFESPEDIYNSLERFEHELFGLAEGRWQSGFRHIEPIMHETYEKIEQVSQHEGEVTGVPSGFDRLDQLTAGFHPGELIIIAARPGMGKTAFALNLARNAAVQYRQPIGFFSLEMSSESLTQRLLCMESRVDGQSVRTGRLNEPLWNRLSKAVGTLTSAPIFIDDSAALSPLEVRAKARRLVHEHNAQLIVVDYLQLMHVSRRLDNRAQEVGEISQALKAMAKDLKIPVVACAQVTRDVEKRGDTRPKLSDLRESGSIEQDADVVMFVHRPEYYKIMQDEEGRSLEGVAEIIVEKQRNGPTGKVYLRWFDKYGLFEPLASDDEMGEDYAPAPVADEDDDAETPW
jgi:replicative DNA helicase